MREDFPESSRVSPRERRPGDTEMRGGAGSGAVPWAECPCICARSVPPGHRMLTPPPTAPSTHTTGSGPPKNQALRITYLQGNSGEAWPGSLGCERVQGRCPCGSRRCFFLTQRVHLVKQRPQRLSFLGAQDASIGKVTEATNHDLERALPRVSSAQGKAWLPSPSWPAPLLFPAPHTTEAVTTSVNG